MVYIHTSCSANVYIMYVYLPYPYQPKRMTLCGCPCPLEQIHPVQLRLAMPGARVELVRLKVGPKEMFVQPERGNISGSTRNQPQFLLMELGKMQTRNSTM